MIKGFNKQMMICSFVAVMSLNCSFICADSIKSNPDFKDTISKTSDLIKKTMKENEIVGLSIALVYDNEVVWTEGFGWADKENKIPAETKTVYMLGSGSKTLATVALLQYLDKGSVSLDDPVYKHINDFTMLERFRNQSKEMTVRRLLNHHSGIPGDLYNNMGVTQSWNKWDSNLYIDWLISYLSDDYPSYAPGEIAIYCNTGFILVGELIKKLSEEKNVTFNDIMTKNLLQPLKMSFSSFNIIKDNLAKGYINGKIVAPIQFNGISGATGGLFTSVEDMSKFMIMLLNEGEIPNGKRILNSKTVVMMGEPEVSPLDINSYFIPGLGFDSVKDSTLSYAGRTWIKDGSTENFNSIMGFLPDKKMGVIILTNCDSSQLVKYPIMRECLKSALLEKFKLKPIKPKYPNWTLKLKPEKLVGKYVYSTGYDKIIRGERKNSLILKRCKLKKKAITKKLFFNGKRYSIEGSAEEILFKDIGSNILMIQYGTNNSEVDKYMYDDFVIKTVGVKTELPGISDVWRKRLDQVYLIDNMSWNDVSWEDALIFTIIEKRGNLVVDLKGAQTLVVPDNDEITAFVPGLNNRGDSSIRFVKESNEYKVSFSSYSGHDIKYIAEISTGYTMEIDNLEFSKVAWYKYDTRKSEGKITFSITESDRKYKLRLFDEDFKLVKDGENVFDWNSEKGTWYLAVSPLPGKMDMFTLKVMKTDE